MATVAETSGLNLELEPVENLIFEGLQNNILRVFKSPAVWNKTTADAPAIKSLFQGSKPQYPYCLLKLRSWSESADRQNTQSSARRGVTSVVTSDRKRAYKVHFIPTDFSVEVKFFSQDYAKVLDLSNKWLFARRLGWLKFETVYGNTVFTVGTEMSAELEIPDRDASLEENSEFVITTTLVVKGYISLATLIEQQVADTIEVSLGTHDQSQQNVVWKFDHSLAPGPAVSTTTFKPK